MSGLRNVVAPRRMPSFFIRLRSVFGCMFSRTAAPSGPSTTQPVLSERGDDMRALDVFERARGWKRRARRAAPACRRRRGVPARPAVKSAPMSSTPPLDSTSARSIDVLELADVAGPRIGHQAIHAVARDTFDGPADAFGVTLDEEHHELRDVDAVVRGATARESGSTFRR